MEPPKGYLLQILAEVFRLLELEQLPERIQQLESKQAELNARINSSDFYQQHKNDPAKIEQALDALFGGPAPRSPVETSALDRAGAAAPGIRSNVGDPATATVAKGRATRDIIAAPEGDGQAAQAVIPS